MGGRGRAGCNSREEDVDEPVSDSVLAALDVEVSEDERLAVALAEAEGVAVPDRVSGSPVPWKVNCSL